ncbi:SDR family NAD(P)-dependent oxidoreductase [Neobacillus sp. D3-1R]|uniref:SDR family NAD(P)-dependent oxidoreductase n=1 Tax=Neobacillus sp. D3-1R TaxID=3445778 RepID=UPI003F9FB9D5
MSFKGKTVIITGGANGIGRSIVRQFAELNANIVIADINEENGNKLKNELKKKQKIVEFKKTNVKNLDEIKDLMTFTYELFGSIDILINNAGISKFHSFWEMTSEIWDDVMDTNLKGYFFCSLEAAKLMKKNGGKIVNIASTRAFMSEPNTEAYSASKGGIVALTHALANTLSPHAITVNCISPGWIETVNYDELKPIDHSQHLSNRVGKPDDIARACIFLCDAKNDFVNGENITIDGGMTKKMIYEE